MSAELDRLAFIAKRDGEAAAVDFATRTLAKYRECLLLKRRVLDARGEFDRKPHHATFPDFRRRFVDSCVTFRGFIRRTNREGRDG
jgi:hypothetical protein